MNGTYIDFSHDETARDLDIKIFRQWERNEITIDEACRAIAYNNSLPYVSKSDFENEACLLGYYNKNKKVY